MHKYLIFLLLFTISTAVSNASPFRSLCSSLNTPPSRESFHHHGRCYVISAQATNITWATAATTCTDMPSTVHGGLAMWLPLPVFDWMFNSVFKNKKWVIVGLHANTTTGHGDSSGKAESDGMRFGQGPTVNHPSWATSSTDGVLIHGGWDQWVDTDSVGQVYIKRTDYYGYGDDSWESEYDTVLCAYEDLKKNFQGSSGRRLTDNLRFERYSFTESHKCMEKCHIHALCNSFAYSILLADCQLYMVAGDDIGGLFDTWIVHDENYMLFLNA